MLAASPDLPDMQDRRGRKSTTLSRGRSEELIERVARDTGRVVTTRLRRLLRTSFLAWH